MESLNTGTRDTRSNYQLNCRQPEPFDWYQIYTGIKDVITQYITKSNRVLNIGAGNSSNELITIRIIRRHVR